MICDTKEAGRISIARDFLSHSLFGRLIVIHSFDRSVHLTTILSNRQMVGSAHPTLLISRLLRVALIPAS